LPHLNVKPSEFRVEFAQEGEDFVGVIGHGHQCLFISSCPGNSPVRGQRHDTWKHSGQITHVSQARLLTGRSGRCLGSKGPLE